jgi:Zn finger protein HypA/HybF involved in hydrogenase expression
MDFMTAYAVATQVLKTLKDLASVGKALDTAELKLKIAELSETMADLKLAHIEAKDDLAARGAEIDKLKKLLQRKAELVEFQSYSYEKTKDGKPKGLPYCPVCEQKDGLLIRMTPPPRGMATSTCPNCKAMYHVERFGYDE